MNADIGKNFLETIFQQGGIACLITTKVGIQCTFDPLSVQALHINHLAPLLTLKYNTNLPF